MQWKHEQTKAKIRRFLTVAAASLIGILALCSGSTAAAQEYLTTDLTVTTTDIVIAATGVTEATGTTDSTTLTPGWQESDEGRRYLRTDGTYAVGSQEIDGVWYLFDYNGVQKLGWRTVNGIRRYYSPETGEPIYGWVSTGGYRYYVNSVKGKLTGEIKVGGIRYMLDETYGSQALGFCTFSDDTVSYYDETGEPVSGWQTIDESKYYFNSSYIMQTGWQTLSGSKYYFAEDGAMQTGFQTISSKMYYFNDDGIMQTGWQTVSGKKYYLNSSGVVQTGWQTISGSKYYFDTTSGAMLTGWQTISDSKYYFGSDGKMYTGNQTIDGTLYHFSDTGELRTVRVCLDAGHYGKYNQSPVNSAYYESDMTWKLHLYLKEALESYGIEVITTRSDKDTDLGLETRGMTAEGCDLFLSIHSNATTSTSNDAPLACCSIDGEMDTLGLTLANTIHEVMGTNQSGSIWKRVGNNGDYYGVLRGAAKVGVSGILLEHSCHTNLAATNWLLVDSNLEKLAKAEAAVIAAYFGMT